MLKQILSQKQQMRMSPLQIQQIKLLELPVAALEQRVKEELEDNPALEEEVEDAPDLSTFTNSDDSIPSYRLHDNNQPLEVKDRAAVRADGMDFHELMLAQLALRPLNERQREIGTFLIGCLDSDGYLRRPLSDIANDIAFAENKEVSEEELRDMLCIIQDLEPTGVGARNLRECLLLQLNAKENQTKTVLLAAKILSDFFDDFSNKRFEKIQAALNISERELKAASAEITKLNPRPGAALSEDTESIAPAITPDFVVEYRDGILQQSLTARNAPDLRVNSEYVSLLKKHSKDKEASEFIRKKIDSARWFISAVQQRYYTLAAVMSAIVQRQQDFFTTGDEAKLQPMLLKAIAEDTGYDLSTISRVVNSKYVQTNFGIFSLKFFFSESTKTDSGEEVSTRKVKVAIKKLVDAEDKHKPLGDEEISQLLKSQGFIIARRTVAKYREMLNIPVARMRKSI